MQLSERQSAWAQCYVQAMQSSGDASSDAELLTEGHSLYGMVGEHLSAREFVDVIKAPPTVVVRAG